MNVDIYAEASDLQRSLEQTGELQLSRRVHDAIAQGSTGTEILMRLRAELSSIQTQSAARLSEGQLALVQSLIVVITTTLRSVE
jgi:hypothetical protein